MGAWPIRKYLRPAVRAGLMAAALAGATVTGAASSAEAATSPVSTQVTEVAYTAQVGKVQPVEWHGERQGCKVNVYAKARLAWLKAPGEPAHLGLLVTTNGDIHNPWVFVGQTVPFTIDVMVDGILVDSIPHELYAPAVLDPKGSDKWYEFKDEASDVEDALDDLKRITLEISI